MTQYWPQFVILGLMFVALGINLAKDGEERSPHSFFWTLIAVLLEMFVLSAGGFFDCFAR